MGLIKNPAIRMGCRLLPLVLSSFVLAATAVPLHSSVGTAADSTSQTQAEATGGKAQGGAATKVMERLKVLVPLSGQQLRKGSYEEARETLLETLDLAEELRQDAVVASACYRLGLAAVHLEGSEAALPYYMRAISMSEEANPSLNALSRNAAAQELNNLNRHMEALELLGAAAERAQGLESPKWTALQAQIVANTAVAEYYLGEYLKALDHLDQALGLFTYPRDRLSIDLTSLHKANTLTQLGRLRTAQATFSQVADEAARAGNSKIHADALSGLGNLCQYMGNQQRALEYLAEALEGHRQGDNARSMAHDHMTIAAVNINLQQYGKALEHYDSALALYNLAGSHAEKGFALANQGFTHLLSGNPRKAREDIESSMRLLSQSENPMEIAIAYEYMGRVDLALGRHGDARGYFHKALQLARYMDRPETIWRAESGLGEVYEAAGSVSSAAEHYLLAVRSIESVRQSLPQDVVSQDYLYDKHEVYNGLIRTLLEVNDKYAALSTLDKRNRWAARHLFVMSVEFESPLRRSLAEKERVLSARLEKYREAVRRSDGGSSEGQHKRDRLDQEVRSVRKEREDLLTQIKKQDPILYQGLATEPLDVQFLINTLRDGVAVVAYFFSGDDLHVFFATRGSLQVRTVPAVRPGVLDALQEIRTSVQRPPREETLDRTRQAFLAASRQLHKVLIEPLPSTVRRANKWYVLPDDELWSVPFMGLVGTDGRFEAEQRTIIAINTLKSVARDTTSPASPAEEFHVFALGDPEGALPAASRELALLQSLDSKAVVVTGHGATEERFRAEVKTASIVVLATHADRPPLADSAYLSLAPTSSSDGHLTAQEIGAMDLTHLDLVVLAGCGTAVSEEQQRTFVSLSDAFLFAGVKVVLGTLWDISDPGTFRFVKHFVENWKTTGDYATALQLAQNDCIHEGLQGMTLAAATTRNGYSRQSRAGLADGKAAIDLSHPYFWSPFLLYRYALDVESQ